LTAKEILKWVGLNLVVTPLDQPERPKPKTSKTPKTETQEVEN
jgi:hypothetical protein